MEVITFRNGARQEVAVQVWIVCARMLVDRHIFFRNIGFAGSVGTGNQSASRCNDTVCHRISDQRMVEIFCF